MTMRWSFLILVFILSVASVHAQYVDRTKVTEAVAVTATLQSAATANGDGSTLDVSGYSSVSFVITGTFVATVNFEVTGDDTNWEPLQVVQVGTSTISTTSTSTGAFSATAGSLKTVRARVSGYASGSVTVTARASLAHGSHPQVITGSVTIPSNTSVNLAQVAGSTVATAATGIPKVGVTDGSGNAITSTSNAIDVNIKSGNPATITATQATGTNLHTVVDSGAVNATLQAGSALVGKFGIDQTTPGTTNKVTVGSDVVHTIVDSGSSAVTQATASNLNAQVVGAAASGASKAGNPVQTGGVFNTTQPTVTNGQAVENQATARGAQIVATGADTFNVTVNAALPAGSAVIGHVINDSGSTTAVTGNVTIVQPTGTNLHAVLDANSGVDIGKLTANQSVNLAQVAGATTQTGNGTASGAQRVAVASDNTPFAVKTDQTTHGTTDQVAADMTKVGGTTIVDGGPSGTLGVGGPDANNAAITGNPVLQGVEAQSGQPTAATTGNVRQLVGSLDGALYTRQGGPVTWTCGVNSIAASLTQCQAAPGANLKLYITGIYVQTTTTTSGTYAIQTGTGSNCGTGTAALFPVSGTGNRFNAPITSNAMASITFPVPLAAPANTAVCLIGVATNTISAQLIGFTAP